MNLNSSSSNSKCWAYCSLALFLACSTCPGDLTVDNNEYSKVNTPVSPHDHNIFNNRCLVLYLHKKVLDTDQVFSKCVLTEWLPTNDDLPLYFSNSEINPFHQENVKLFLSFASLSACLHTEGFGLCYQHCLSTNIPSTKAKCHLHMHSIIMWTLIECCLRDNLSCTLPKAWMPLDDHPTSA